MPARSMTRFHARHHRLAVGDVVVAQARVDRVQRRRVDPVEARHLTSCSTGYVALVQLVIVVDLVLVETTLDAGVERVRGVRRNFRAEQIERHGVVEVELLLHRRQVDHAELAHRPMSSRVVMPFAFIASQVRATMRSTPLLPTNMW